MLSQACQRWQHRTWDSRFIPHWYKCAMKYSRMKGLWSSQPKNWRSNCSPSSQSLRMRFSYHEVGEIPSRVHWPVHAFVDRQFRLASIHRIELLCFARYTIKNLHRAKSYPANQRQRTNWIQTTKWRWLSEQRLYQYFPRSREGPWKEFVQQNQRTSICDAQLFLSRIWQ